MSEYDNHALVDRLDLWWRAANYLSVGQLYLRDNPLLKRSLEPRDIKPRLLGHWGTTPGLNFMWAHCNRAIVDHDIDAVFVCGPGHGAPAVTSNAWLEGAYEVCDPKASWSVDGMRHFFRRFSAPGGVPSHAAPETPGSFHEGGELGYSLAHAQGAVFDDPDLIAFCAIGDGEAETGPLAGSWAGGRFLSLTTDGAVVPILHVNGFKIANPTVPASIPESELQSLLEGQGYDPHVVSGSDPTSMHEMMAVAMDECITRIRELQATARAARQARSAPWPMIVLRSPKGWTGPDEIDGHPVEGHFNAHQIPIPVDPQDSSERRRLERWLRSYEPENLFTPDGRPTSAVLASAPNPSQRMSTNPVSNGGSEPVDLDLPEIATHAVKVGTPGSTRHEATRVAGLYLRDVISTNRTTFRLFGADEVASNRLDAVFQVTGRRWLLSDEIPDGHLDPNGRVMEVLSEHLCQGWTEGYLLTGRHALFTSYEAFVHIVDSMFNQHAKWIEASAGVSWRRPIPSLNYLLSSHAWRQDHNGFTHQDPGFLDVVSNKKPELSRIYLPPDANCLLAVLDRCLRSRDRVNVIVAGKQSEPQYLDLDAAVEHCMLGLSVWAWAGTEERTGDPPDVVLACAGDVPTMETVAAARILAQHTDLGVRVVNVVDLMSLQSPRHHPHGIADVEFDATFTSDRPVIFAFHGYPSLIHRFTYDRNNHGNFHLRGYTEEGTTTTPFDMVVRNRMDRFNLALSAIEWTGRDDLEAARQFCTDRLADHHTHILEHGEDMDDLDDWQAGVKELRP